MCLRELKKAIAISVLLVLVSLMVGFGTKTVTDMEYNLGGRYTGQVIDGVSVTIEGITYKTVPHGNGKLISASGLTMDGYWEYGLFISPHRKNSVLPVAGGLFIIFIIGGVIYIKFIKPSSDGDIGKESETDEEENETVTLNLTFPIGKSPKVFMAGWLFGAKCIQNPGTPKELDLSESVMWSGSGTFEPEVGPMCRPIFDQEGDNTITLSCFVGGKKMQKTFRVFAVSPERYAHVGTLAHCSSDVHGCPACPHEVIGQINTGSSRVFVAGNPAARVGDAGSHTSAFCCGTNTFVVSSGDPEVLIEGKQAARIGDQTTHCGGVGRLVAYAPEVQDHD